MATSSKIRQLSVLVASGVLAVGSVIGAAGPASAHTKISHADASSQLANAGISVSSSGGCSDRQNSTCTSLEQVNQESISGVITLKNASGCAVNVTGGTEVGHASGTYSHYNGYKIDTSLSSCLDGYIQNSFSYIGGSKWQAGSGNVYYKEGNHWDITYYNCGC